MPTKQWIFSFLVILALFDNSSVSGQQTEDAVIRKLEDQERVAILKGDTLLLSTLMSSRIVVQNPENAIVGFKQIMDRIKAGMVNYASFERHIENIAFIGTISVVMGIETIIPQGTSLHAGKTLKRRFTNIWMKEKDNWKLTARQSTIVAIQ